MKFRIILMWFLTMTVLVGISNADLWYELWEGTSGTLETFFPTALTPTDTGTTDDLQGWVGTYSPGDAKVDFTVRFTGFIDLPTAGDWTFYTWSDDGSRLFIEGDMVVDNDGDHGNREREGTRTLPAGLHAITITFYENGGGDNLEVRYEGPGVAKVNIPNSAFFLSRGKAYRPDPADGEFIRYSTDATELTWLMPDPNDPPTMTADVLWFSGDPNLPGTTFELLVDHTIDGPTEQVSLEGRADTPAHYWWRVDVYDVNGLEVQRTEGDLWTFSSARDVAMVFLDESDGSTAVNEQDPIPNRDEYLLSLSMDPGVPVTITVSEVPRVTDTKETMESYNGETDAVELRVAHSGGAEVLYSVITGDDDGEENDEGGAGNVDLGSSDLEFFDDEGDGGLNQVIGLRFQNVTIAKDSIIDSAFVDFERDEAEASGYVLGFITGEAVGDAPAFVGGAASFDFTTRLAANPTTTVSFVWAGDYGGSEIVPTSDIASIIQEIVNLDDWVSGNSIVLFFYKDTGALPFELEFIDSTTLAVLGQGSWDYVLDSSNWDTGVTVTIAAVDDSELEANPELATLTATTSSADAYWIGVDVDPVIVAIDDNECGAWSFAAYDFDGNCFIDLGDFVKILEEWLVCTMPNVPGSTCVDTR